MSERGRFVERPQELRQIQELLDNPKGLRQAQFFYGEAGSGKTMQLRRALREAASRRCLTPEDPVDLYFTDHHSVEGLMEAVVRRLAPLTGPDTFEMYVQARDALHKARKEESYSPEGLDAKLRQVETEFRASLANLTRGRVVVLALDTFEYVQNSPVGRWILSESGLLVPGLLCFVAGRYRIEWLTAAPLVAQTPLSPIDTKQALTLYALFQAARSLPFEEPHPLIDESDPGLIRLVETLNELAGRNPLMLGLAIYTRAEQPERLLGLAGGEGVEIADDLQLADRLRALSREDFERNTVWFLRDGAAASGVFFPRARKELQRPLRQTLIFMSNLNRRFNRRLLKLLVERKYVQLGKEVMLDELWDHLIRREPDLFYVKGRSEGEVQLHEKFAELVRRHLFLEHFQGLDSSGELLREFGRDVIKWHDLLISEAATEDERNVLRAEKLAYVLQLDLQADERRSGAFQARQLLQAMPPDYGGARQLLVDYMRLRSDMLDRLMVNEIGDEIIGRFPVEERFEVGRRLGEIAHRINALDLSRRRWEGAVQAAQEADDTAKTIVALVGKHNSTWQQDPAQSLAILDQALALCAQSEKQRALVLYEIGFTYRQTGDYERAIQYYRDAAREAEALEAEDVLPTIYNDLGFAHARTGDFIGARARIDQGTELRELKRNELKDRIAALEARLPDLDETERDAVDEQLGELREQLRDAEFKLGLSYNTLGEVGRYMNDLAEATADYSEAISLFRQVEDPYWMGNAFVGRGEAHRRLAMALFRRHRLDASSRYDRMAKDDIEEGIRLHEIHGYTAEQDTANRRLGRLVHDRALRHIAQGEPTRARELIGQARDLFVKGLGWAQQTGDVLEELENSAEIAFLVDDVLQVDQTPLSRAPESVRRDLKQFEDTIEKYRGHPGRPYQFPVFEHLLELEHAAAKFASGELDRALEGYVRSLCGLAQDRGYGAARFHKHLEHFINVFRRLGDREVQEAWKIRFETEWVNRKMLGENPQSLADEHPDFLQRLNTELATSFMRHKSAKE